MTLLEAYRGIASVAVVLHHVGAIALKQYKISFANGFFSACHLRLDFFFVLSGFIIAWLHDQDISKPKSAMPFMLKRLWRIYPLLFLLTTAKLATLIWVGDWGRSKQHLDLSLVVSSYLMLPSERFPIILAAWTMPYEICFYLFFAGAILSSQRVLAAVGLVWAIIICTHQVPVNSAESPAYFFVQPFHLQLMAGMFVGLWVKQHGRPEWSRPIMTAGFICLVIGLVMHRTIESLPLLSARCWWGLVFCLIIPGSALFEIGRSKPITVPGWLRALGRGSYSTYLLHGPILVVLLAWDAKANLLSGPWKDVLLLMAAAIAVAMGLLCHRWVERPLLQWSRRFTHA